MACPETETLQAFVEARLDSSSREEVIAHVDGCPICRSVLVDWARGCSRDDTGLGESPAGEPASVLDLQRGTKLDHFVVLEPLGSGGMGMVVSAYDPDLDRKVAIKLMRPDGPGSSDAGERRARLVREAQALAKLSHENVITVYQAGTFGEHVYIAMELVEGGTLSTWLRRTRRAWREVVAMFLRVGSGLAAAHAAGFVHRDFKPENVLVGDDGRVRVTDFGLVDTAGSTGGGSSSPSSPVLSSLTRTGALVGTPRYMAPEQHARKRLDARADQFAFAVSLHEALYAVPPFLGGSYDELVTNVRAGTVRPPPPRAKVPAWLRRIVLRGLAPAPDDRYPSMAALMADLARDPGRWRRRIVALGAVATLVTAAVLVTWRAGGDAEPPCSGAEQNLAGVWDAASKARARIAFLATGTPFAEDAWRATERHLDGYTAAWTRMHRSACLAARAGEQSAQALDLRMACLGRRLDHVHALSRLFASADSMVVERAPTAAAALEPLDGCADLTRLAAPLALPGDPRRRDAIAEARRLLADAVTRHDAGKYVEALPLLGTAVAIGRALAYPPLEAEALYRLGRLQDRLGDAVAAEETLFAATVAATHGGHLEVAADAQIELIFVAGVILAKSEVGRHAGEQGAALLARLGDDPGRRAKLLRYQGFLLDAQSRYPEARARFLDALALEEQLGDGPSIELAGVLTAIFKNDYREGRYAAALPNARRALAMIESTVGPHHPFVGFAATNLGAVLDALRRYPEALEQHSRSLAVLEAVVGPDHPEVARTLVNTAQAYVSLGRYDEAIAASRRAIAISERMSSPHEDLAVFYQGLGDALLALERLPESHVAYQTAADIQEKKWGPEDVTLAEILHGFGHLLRREGNHEQAYRAYRRAHAIFEKRMGPDFEVTATALASMGVALFALGHTADGLASVERARATLEKLGGPEHHAVGVVLLQLGELRRDHGEHDLAIRAFGRAVAIFQQGEPDTRRLAASRFALARELWDTRDDRARAIVLARAAELDLQPLGPAADRERKRITTWVALRSR